MGKTKQKQKGGDNSRLMQIGEINVFVTGENHANGNDKELFDRICGSFTPQVRNLLSSYDFHGSFVRAAFDPLLNLLHDFEIGLLATFGMPELDSMRKHLMEKIKAFLIAKSEETFVVDGAVDMNQVDGPGAEDGAKRLNETANELWQTFREFEEKGREIVK